MDDLASLTSAPALHALCRGVSHRLSLISTLAFPNPSSVRTTEASPMKAAACSGDLFSSSSLWTSEGSSSTMRSTSSGSPEKMARMRMGCKGKGNEFSPSPCGIPSRFLPVS